MMTLLRNRMFLEGIAIGGVCGIVIGSIIAFAIGESRKEALRRIIDDRLASRRQIPFEYLSQ